jgi:hypothetical protein
VFSATFNNISAISWRSVLFSGGNRRALYTDFQFNVVPVKNMIAIGIPNACTNQIKRVYLI